MNSYVFPKAINTDADEYTEPTGLTKREYFAAATLSGFCRLDGLPMSSDEVARRAFRIADAMIDASKNP